MVHSQAVDQRLPPGKLTNGFKTICAPYSLPEAVHHTQMYDQCNEPPYQRQGQMMPLCLRRSANQFDTLAGGLEGCALHEILHSHRGK